MELIKIFTTQMVIVGTTTLAIVAFLYGALRENNGK